MDERYGRKSRRETPWDDRPRDPTQQFLYSHYNEHYDRTHLPLAETGESEVINSLAPDTCPFCGSTRFVKAGLNSNGVQRYRCSEPDCKRRFTPLSGTIFEDHKISISEWMEYMLNVFRYVSTNATSCNNKNAFTTSRYWLEKLFLISHEYVADKVLSGQIWFDETYWSVRSDQLVRHEDESKLRGISQNQMCIGVACTKKDVVCIYEGLGKPTSQGTLEAFQDHIAPGSTLIHDMEAAHMGLVKALGLQSTTYNSKDLKGMSDKVNPLRRVNETHARLKNFLESHTSFDRSKFQGYLDVFSIAYSEPQDPLLKVEALIKFAFSCRKTLRYRVFYNVHDKF